jgi:exonuclease III
MKIVSWNYRGLGNKENIKSVKQLVKLKKTLILRMQEKKMKDSSVLQERRYFWKNNTEIAVSSRGASGGLCTLWSRNSFNWWRVGILNTGFWSNWCKTQHVRIFY